MYSNVKMRAEAPNRNKVVSFVDQMFIMCSTASVRSDSIKSDHKNRALFSSPTNVPTVERTVSG